MILKTESPETGNSVEEVDCAFQKMDDNGQTNDAESRLKISFTTKFLTGFFSIHVARSSGDGHIVWKFTGESGQTEMTFKGEEKLFSYILVQLKL